MNSKGHLYISLAKSVIRILGCLFAAKYNSLNILAISFMTAEVLGVFEELVDQR